VNLFFIQNKTDKFGKYFGREDGREVRSTWKRSSLVISVMGPGLSSALGIVDFDRVTRALIISSSFSIWASALVSSFVAVMIALRFNWDTVSCKSQLLYCPYVGWWLVVVGCLKLKQKSVVVKAFL